MGKRMPLVESAKANRDEAEGFGEQLAGLRRAAGFPQAEPAAGLEGSTQPRRRLLAIEKLDVPVKRHILERPAAFIERGQRKRKVEGHA